MATQAVPRPFVRSCAESGLRALHELNLLIVSDDAALRRELHIALHSTGFGVGEAVSSDQAVALCRIVHYDALLLDVNAMGDSAVDRCADLRSILPQLAIVLLGTSSDHHGMVEALEAGADAWLCRYAEPRELTARICACLRRVPDRGPGKEYCIEIGNVSLNPTRRLLQKSGTRVHLTPREFDLLYFLISRPGIPVSRGRLLHLLWGDECLNQIDSLRTLVHQLRRKIEDDPATPRYLLTEARVGYRFVDPADWFETNPVSG